MNNLILEDAWEPHEYDIWGLMAQGRLHQLVFHINRQLGFRFRRYLPQPSRPRHHALYQSHRLRAATRNRRLRRHHLQHLAPSQKEPASEFPTFLESVCYAHVPALILVSNRQTHRLSDADLTSQSLETYRNKRVLLEPRYKRIDAFILRHRDYPISKEELSYQLKTVTSLRGLMLVPDHQYHQLKGIRHLDLP